MAKALKNFYWKSVFYEVGDNAPNDAPNGFVEKPKKAKSKNGKPKNIEDK